MAEPRLFKDKLVAVIRDDVLRRKDVLGRGGASSFEHYREEVGRIKQAEHSLDLIEHLWRQTTEDDDDDDGKPD